MSDQKESEDSKELVCIKKGIEILKREKVYDLFLKFKIQADWNKHRCIPYGESFSIINNVSINYNGWNTDEKTDINEYLKKETNYQAVYNNNFSRYIFYLLLYAQTGSLTPKDKTENCLHCEALKCSRSLVDCSCKYHDIV